ncbi:MAG: enoyl-CoA hydratase-related protein [Actinomycetota bacterium]|nr:enoyl-CoA hydratase-related protein [Actinomycetota bacterium]HZY66109.1 enoyl-CoA hydratase-related protein [Rubrobacteraceae bacterium]
MDGYENLKVRADGFVLHVSLNRPDTRNALNAGLIADLTDCFEQVAEDETVRVVVLSGEGRSFCAGADIGYMRDTANFTYEENLEDARRLAAMYRAVEACPKPVVAAVRGAAIGGGAGLVAAADVVLAEEGTVFAFSEVRLGIAPATIAPFVVRKIGLSQARTLFLVGERFDAGRAQEIGLVHEAVPEDRLDETVEEKVSQLLKGGPRAQAATKGLLDELRSAAPDEITGLMAHRIAALRTGVEGQEGLGAFMEKRKPAWRGEQ